MARGFLGGVISGTLVAAVGAGALSLAVEPPRANAPEAQVQVPGVATPEVGSDAAESAAARASEGQAPAPAAAEQATAPESDSAAEVDAQTAAQPEATSETDNLTTPETTDAPELEVTEDAAPSVQAPTVAPEAPASEESPEVALESAAPEAAPQDEPVAEPVAEVAPEPLPEPLPDAEREEITLTVPSIPEAGAPAPVPAPAGQVATGESETARVSIGTPARTLGNGSSSTLPTLGNTAEADAAAPADGPLETVDINDLPPVERYAEPFVGQEGTPKMAIVLIDDGTSDIGVEALSTFPYPISFAVDTSWDGATEAMQKYREDGFEVLAMVNLPRGARASDVEVSMPVLLEKVPEAVAIMETPDAGLQASRDVIAQVTEYAGDSGHGLLLFPKGLNTAQKLAAKEGVPSATVFRDFDGRGQNASAIKRFLNHAGLKAGSEGGVIMLGRLRADTISALLLWGLQERGDRLELTPVSILLKTQ